MADRRRRSRHFLGALLLLALAAAACERRGPDAFSQSLQAGDQLELGIDPGGQRRFSLDIPAGSSLRLTVDQDGLDIELQVEGLPGPVDAPLGVHVPEEIWLDGARGETATVLVKAIGGRGAASLSVDAFGSETDGAQVAADSVLFWQAFSRLPQAEALVTLREVQSRTRDRSRRLRYGALLAFAELKADPERAAADLEPLLAELAPGDLPALRAQLLLLRAKAAYQRQRYDASRTDFLAAASTAGKAADWEAAGVAEAELGNLDWNAGSADAIRHFAAASRHFHEAGAARLERRSRFQLARCLMRRGSTPEALALLLRGLAELAEDGPVRERADFLREIGWWLMLENRADEGRRLMSEAVALDPETFANFQRLAVFDLAVGDFEAARVHLERAARGGPLAVAPSKLAAMECTYELAKGRIAAARSQCRQALERPDTAETGERPHLALLMAEVERAAGDLRAAELKAREAVAGVEQQRQKAGNELDRMEFLAVRTESRQLLVELRLALDSAFPRAGWDRAAFAASEGTRARTLRDLLEAEEGSAGFFPDADRRRRDRELRQILGAWTGGLLSSYLAGQGLPPAAIAALDPPLAELDRMRQDEVPGPALPRGRKDEDLPPGPTWLSLDVDQVDLAAISSELEPGTVVLAYYLGDREAFGWAITRDGLRGAPLGSAESLRGLAASLYRRLAEDTPFSEELVRSWSAKLSGRLLTPFAAEIDGARICVLVTPAELQILPFAALPYPAASGRPWIASHRLAYLPTASLLPALRRRFAHRAPAEDLLAVVDDPVYDDDPRLPAEARRPGPWRPLTTAAREGASLAARAARFRVRRFTGFEANRERLLGSTLASYRLLHFATHGRTGAAPYGLVLSRFDEQGRQIGDLFGNAELETLALRADLAVLSSCGSALGENIPGEGLLGLSQGFFRAGVPRLVLTLWPVGGERTLELVDHFYRRLLAGVAPAEALRQAQLDLIGQGAKIQDWAAFSFFGDPAAWPNFPPPAVNKGLPSVSLPASIHREGQGLRVQ